MSYNMQGNCWHCGTRLLERDYGRESTCPECNRSTHVCRNCRFYDTARPNACTEPVADPVTDKERPNFCGYFEAREQQGEGASTKSDESLRQAADELFDI